MTRSLLLREVVSMFRKGAISQRELVACINMLNKHAHPRFVHKRLCAGTL